MADVHYAEYGRAYTFNFELFEIDGVDLRVDAAHATADTVIMKDEGAEANTGSGFIDEGKGYSQALTATEMQAARITYYCADQSTKVWLDKVIKIETYGHPSSAHPWMTPYWTNGAVNDASASATAWTFDGFTEATADHVIGSELTFTSGANAGQCRTVTDYTSTVITVSPAFLAAPADDDEFVLRASPTTSAGNVPGVDIAAILTDTAVIGALGAGLTDLGGMSTGMKGEVNAEADTALSDSGIEADLDNGTDGLTALKTAIDAIPTTAMRGTDSAALASEVTAGRMSELDDSAGKLVAIADLIQTAVDAIKLETDKLTLGDAGAGVAGSIIEEIENRATPAQVNTEVDTAFTTQMADSVPADGTIPTREQTIYMIGQFLMDFSISGTTLTVRKVDGSTTLMTFTLDDDTSPTDITRAT